MRSAATVFQCNEISFPPGSIPVRFKESGINLFNFRSTTIERIKQAVWFGSISNEEKSLYATEISSQLTILTPGERYGNLFALSIVHRCISIFISSAKLYIDNSKMRQSYKYIASTALSILPALFLIYVVGYPPMDLILNACISQAFSSVLSYCSLRAGNYIRSLDLISDTKEVSKAAYMSRVLVSSMIDMLLTLAWHGKDIYTDPLKKHDNYHVINYCITSKISATQDFITLTAISPSTPLISFADKFIWLAGRMTMDTLICGAHALGHVKDIRSPFVNAFAAVKRRAFTTDTTAKVVHTKQARPKKLTAPTTNDQTASYVAYEPQRSGTAEYRRRQVDEKKKTHGEASAANAGADNEPASEQSAGTVGEITMHGFTFYKIEGQRIPDNTWGVISLKKEDVEAYERSLAGGHAGNRHSAIQRLTNGQYEIRPRSLGDRVLGNMHRGTQGFTQVLLLGEAMTVYDHIKSFTGNIEPNLIVFNSKVKHEEIGRSR